MEFKLNPKKGMAALCAIGATNLLMSGVATQDTVTGNDNVQSLFQSLCGVGVGNDRPTDYSVEFGYKIIGW